MAMVVEMLLKSNTDLSVTIKPPFFPMSEPTAPEQLRTSEEVEQSSFFRSREEIRKYLDVTRAAYRAGDGSYQGRRSDDQDMLHEMLEVEAMELMHGVEDFIINLTGGNLPDDKSLKEFKEGVHFGKLDLQKMREAFSQLYAGWGILTHRLARDNEGYANQYPEFFQLSKEDRLNFGLELLSDFQDLNRLRFGIEGAGIMKRVHAFDDHGNVIEPWPLVDKDVLHHNEDILRRASDLGYVEKRGTNASIHAAGKMSPDQVKELRKENPTLDSRDFIRQTWFFRNVREQLQDQSQKPLKPPRR